MRLSISGAYPLNRIADDQEMPTPVESADLAAVHFAGVDRNTLSKLVSTARRSAIHCLLQCQTTLRRKMGRVGNVFALPKGDKTISGKSNDVAAMLVNNVNQRREAIL
jgi:hypothetical protein